MLRLTLIILTLFSIIAGSCSNRKNQLTRSNLIPEKELVSVLTDIYIANGLQSIPKINHWFSTLDSLSSYYQIIEKHGYSKEALDNTMKYYFIKKPKKLIKIYDQVLGILSEMESLVEKEAEKAETHIDNLWTGKAFYSFPDPSGTDSTLFDIAIYRPGVYTLSFTASLFPDDQSFNPRITCFSYHPDSLETGKRNYIETINYIKDGQPHTYTLTINVPKIARRHVRGCLYDYDNNPYEWGKHVIFADISLLFTRASL